MIISEAQGSLIDLINESVSNQFTESTEMIRNLLIDTYKQKGRLFLSESEMNEFNSHLNRSYRVLRELDYTLHGILNEDSRNSVLCPVREDSSIDSQVEKWKKEVYSILGKVSQLQTASHYKEKDVAKNALAGTLILLIGSGVSIVLAMESPVIGLVALLVSLGAALYFLFQASFHSDEQDEYDSEADHLKNELRIKAKRILPQLDEMERKATNKATRSSIQALRSTLESVALDEYEEIRDREIKNTNSMAVQARYAAHKDSVVRSKHLELKDKITDLERKVREKQ